MMHKCWSLYNRVEKLRIDDLTKDQVRTILLAVPTSKMAEWFACREGEMHWQPIRDFPEFYEDASMMKGEFQPEAEATSSASTNIHTAVTVPGKASKKAEVRRPMFEEPSPEPTSSTLKIESVPTKERRSARRYVRNLNFYATADGEKFECATRDISMAGISLTEQLPKAFVKNFRAELRLGNARIKILVGRVNSTSVKIQECEAWDQLRQWIVSW